MRSVGIRGRAEETTLPPGPSASYRRSNDP